MSCFRKFQEIFIRIYFRNRLHVMNTSYIFSRIAQISCFADDESESTDVLLLDQMSMRCANKHKNGSINTLPCLTTPYHTLPCLTTPYQCCRVRISRIPQIVGTMILHCIGNEQCSISTSHLEVLSKWYI